MEHVIKHYKTLTDENQKCLFYASKSVELVFAATAKAMGFSKPSLTDLKQLLNNEHLNTKSNDANYLLSSLPPSTMKG